MHKTSQPMDLKAIVGKLDSDDFRYMADELANDYGEREHEEDDYDQDGREEEIDSLSEMQLTDQFLEVFNFYDLDNPEFELDDLSDLSQFRLPPSMLTENLQKALGLFDFVKNEKTQEERRKELRDMIKDINLGHTSLDFTDLKTLKRAVDVAYSRLADVKKIISKW